jgi:tetratricopeptide (TPR) repeat protein
MNIISFSFIRINKVHFLVVLLSLLAFQSNSIAQSAIIDSLKSELKIHKKASKKRVDLLNDLAFESYSRDLDATLIHLKEAKKISAELNYTKGKAKAIYIEGVTEVIQSNLDQALKLFEKSIQLYESIDDNEGISSNYNGIGIIYYYKGDYYKSIDYYKKSLKLDEETGEKAKIKSSLNNIGSSYSDLGEFDKALVYYKRAIKINRELNDRDGIAASLNNIGTIYDDQGNYPLALEYYNKSLSIYQKIKDTVGQSRELNNLGLIYKNNEDYEKATNYFKQTLKIQKKAGDKRNVSKVLNNLGIVSLRKEEFKLALNYFNEALVISRSIDDVDNISKCLNNIGDVYLSLKNNNVANKYYSEAKLINIEIDDQLGLCNSYLGIASTLANQKKYKDALLNALKSKAIADKVGLLEFQSDVNKLLSEIYRHMGDYPNAYESHQLFKKYNDSLFNKENIEKIAQIENEYKYKGQLESAKNREVKLTQKVKITDKDLKKSQQDFLMSIIIFLVITMLLGGVIFYLRLRNIKSKTQNIIIEQKLLRSQMTPHFIFNSLSVLQGMILNKEEKKSVSYLSKFSKLLRIILENSRFKTVSLDQEIAAVDNYLSLQNLENQSYHYTIEVDENLDQTAVEIPPMLIQPFVENAIEHAFVNQNEDKKIDIHISYVNHRLICTITDNGIGVNAQKEDKRKDKTSLSTTITSERLKIISKDYKMKGSVSIVDRKINNEQGTIVTLVIPYKKK